MLVIARRAGEGVQIGSEIEVRVVRIGRSRVTIAIAAPRALKVLRVGASADDRFQHGAPEATKQAANETIRQRRVRLASR